MVKRIWLLASLSLQPIGVASGLVQTTEAALAFVGIALGSATGGWAIGLVGGAIPGITSGMAIAAIISALSVGRAGYRLLLERESKLEITTRKEMIMGEFAGRPKEMDWHRICVHNASKTAQAKDVEVKLQTIDPDPLLLKPYPSALGIKGGARNTANPGDDILFDFVQDKKTGYYRVWTVEFQGQEFSLANVDYIATFSISSAETNTVFKRFKMRQPMRRDEGNFLRLDGDLEFTLLPDELAP